MTGETDHLVLSEAQARVLDLCIRLTQQNGGPFLNKTLRAHPDGDGNGCILMVLEKQGLVRVTRGRRDAYTIEALCGPEVFESAEILSRGEYSARVQKRVKYVKEGALRRRLSRAEEAARYGGQRYEDHDFKKEPERLNPYLPGRGGKTGYGGMSGCSSSASGDWG